MSGAALAVRVAEDATRLIASLRLAQSLLRILIAGLAAYLLVPPLAGALGLWPALAPHAEGLAFLREFQALAGETLSEVDVVICPPFTSIWELAQALHGSRGELGAQDLAAAGEIAQTGQVSAALLRSTATSARSCSISRPKPIAPQRAGSRSQRTSCWKTSAPA